MILRGVSTKTGNHRPEFERLKQDIKAKKINTTSAKGKMISRLLMSVSQNEIERTSERTKVGMAGAIKSGLKYQ